MELNTKVYVILDRKDLMLAKTAQGIMVSLPPDTRCVEIHITAEIKINGED